jgi:cobalt-zinc-cadmium efflux system outer membrane protein
MHDHRFYLGLLLSIALTSPVAWAQQEHEHAHEQAPPSHGVLLDVVAVRQRAEAAGPGVLPARVAGAEAGRVRSAVNLPLTHPPRLEVEVGRRTAPGGNGLDVSARVWQDLSLGGYASARRHYADALKDRSKANAELARRDAIARGLYAWVDARYGRELLALRRESSRTSEELLRIAQARVNAGTAPPSEASLARSVVGAAHAAVLAAEGAIIVADGDLRYAVALSPDAQVNPVGDLTRTDDRAIDEAATVELAQKNHPVVTQARMQATMAERSAEVAMAAGRPFVGVGLSYTHEADGARVVGGIVSLPLPFVNPNVLDVAVSRGDAAVGRAQVTDVQATIAREVRQAVHERHHARQVREELWTMAVLPGRDAIKEITRRFEAGAIDLAIALAARREVLTAEEGFLAAAADVQRADIRLEHAVGGPVPRKISP